MIFKISFKILLCSPVYLHRNPFWVHVHCVHNMHTGFRLVKWFNLSWMWGSCVARNLSALKMHRLFQKYKISGRPFDKRDSCLRQHNTWPTYSITHSSINVPINAPCSNSQIALLHFITLTAPGGLQIPIYTLL